MNITLYKCTSDVALALDKALDKETGEIVSSQELESAIGQFQNKAQSIVAYMLNRKAVSAARKAHIASIKLIDEAEAKKDAALNAYLSENMAATGIKNIEALDGTFKATLYVDRDVSIHCDEDAEIDLRFARVIPEKIEWDKVAIKTAIKNGEPVPSCVRLVKKDRLEIK